MAIEPVVTIALTEYNDLLKKSTGLEEIIKEALIKLENIDNRNLMFQDPKSLVESMLKSLLPKK